MSIGCILWALKQNPGPQAAKLALIKLADSANDQGKCWPSMAYLAHHTNMSPNGLRTQIKKLADLGFLKIIPRVVDGSQLPNIYLLNITAEDGWSISCQYRGNANE